MYTMKQVCDELHMTYETLRFYCDKGLIPNIKRNSHNYRLFDEKNIAWIQGLQHLKRCGMSISDMKKYMLLCLEGPSSIMERKEMLDIQKKILLEKKKEIDQCLVFIEDKQTFYNDILEGTIPYTSNIIK